MYTFPGESTPTPKDRFTEALVAGPVSPEYVQVPVPETLLITPRVTLRTRQLK